MIINSTKTLLAKFKAKRDLTDSKGNMVALARGTKKELSTGITLVGNGYEDYDHTWMDVINENFIALNKKIDANSNATLSGDIQVLESIFDDADASVVVL